MTDNAPNTLAEWRQTIHSGERTPEEAVQTVLDAIKAKDKNIGAYVNLNEEEALKEARQIDTKLPLAGIPIGIKDVLNVKGQSCRCGSDILNNYTSPYDATAVKRLKKEGAIILGRLNMDEFAMGSSTENSAYGPTRNPHDKDRVPGGSSGGSAAAVASGMAIAALGTDTGGSIRQPASFCGCVGLKPTYGRVSRYGLTAYASSLDQIGPLAKTVEDAAIMLNAIAGWDPKDSTSLNVSTPDFTAALQADIKGLTLGVPLEYMEKGIDPEVAEKVQGAIEQCRELGANIKNVNLPHTEYAIACYYIIATAEASANLARFDGVRYGMQAEDAKDPIDLYRKTRAAGFGIEVKRRIILGTYALSSGYYDAYYLKAQKVRQLIRKDFKEVFQNCDALLSPVAPTAAYKIGEKLNNPLQMYLGDICTVPVNLAGICAISVPCGKTQKGLPVGLHIIAPEMGEETLFRVGHSYEQIRNSYSSDFHPDEMTATS